MLSDEILNTLAERGMPRSVEELTARGKALHDYLGQFSSDQQDLLLVPHRSDFTVSELAEIRKKSVNALYKMLGRLREKLTECIGRRLGSAGGLS